MEAATYIHAGSLIDGESTSPLPEMTIVIENNKITKIDAGYIEPSLEDEYIDLTAYTVLPGLIDMHVHLTSQSSPSAYLERVTLNTADYTIRGAVNAKKTLMSGFTTVRNLGDSDSITISLRNAIKEGLIPGPRIYSAGKSIATTGGHADPSNSLRKDLTVDLGPEDGIINGKEDAYQAVRYRYKEGADLIKITATGGVLSNAKNGKNPQMTLEEISAIVSAAKDYGFKVAAHGHGAEGIKRAIKAGVHSIEHGTLMDLETIDLMRKNKVYYVPTLLAGNWVTEKAKIQNYYPEAVRVKSLEIGPKLASTFLKAYQAGVKIAFGTDSGVSPHGENAKEFKLMVDSGMSNMEAIQSATKHASILLGEPNIGTISIGNVADIIAVSGDPLEDISILESVDFVMKEGEVYKTL
tara:strand:+ start:21542 stop:22771 length:1230 start_codon:yes stop_codon:yes gene_type:complete